MRNIFQIVILILINLLIANPVMSQEYRSTKDAKGLGTGVQAPLFNARDMHENEFSLQQALDQGPVVMIFYRGHWCPVCNKHLKTLQDSLDVIKEYGATLIAVSPERVPLLGKTEEKTSAEFTLLFDENYQIAKAFDVHFRPGTAQRVMYNALLGADLKKAHSDDSQQLPIPATYVINRSGTIVWRHFDPDYRKRSSVKEIANALEQL